MTEGGKPLTVQEKMALTYAHYEHIKLMKDIYVLAHPGGTENTQVIKNMASAWFKTLKVQEYQAMLRARDETKSVLTAKQMQVSEKLDLPSGAVDFTDLDSFFAFANKQANLLTEEKDRQFYLKTIADLMRFKEGAADNKEDIQRFYTPQKCLDCPLYQKEKENL